MADEGKPGTAGIKGRLAEYWRWAQLARQQTGKPPSAQWREIAALKRLGGQCGATDYYRFKLYDDAFQLGRGAADYLGWRLEQRFSEALNPRYAVLPAWDKAVFTVLAGSAGLPVTPVFASYMPSGRAAPVLGRQLREVDEVGRLLRDPGVYPLFGKPAFSQQGYGTAYLTGYNAATDSLDLLDGQSVPMAQFLRWMTTSAQPGYHKPECGYLFQKPLAVAKEIGALTGWTAVCGVRVVCLNSASGVQPLLAAWKVAVPPNQLDNFRGGRTGNLIAGVDVQTGKVERVLGSMWPEAQVLERLPSSGNVVAGFQLPGWDQVLAACRLGGGVFPLMKVQHWDFALTEDGPIILELNDIGGTDGMQIHGRGMLTPQAREFLKAHANPKQHPWVSGL